MLESSPNHPLPPVGGKSCLPLNWVPDVKVLGTLHLPWDAKWEEMREGTHYGVEGFRTAADKKEGAKCVSGSDRKKRLRPG